MELRQLHHFAAVAEELHFALAALRVHIAQPALSTQIQSLEREVGVQLLVRTTRRLELTRAGATFYNFGLFGAPSLRWSSRMALTSGMRRNGPIRLLLLLEQIGHLDTKYCREPINYLYAWTIDRAFKGAYVGAVKLRAMSKFLLRQSFGLAEPPQILSKSFADLHDAREISCRVFNHGVFSTFDLIGWLILLSSLSVLEQKFSH